MRGGAATAGRGIEEVDNSDRIQHYDFSRINGVMVRCVTISSGHGRGCVMAQTETFDRTTEGTHGGARAGAGRKRTRIDEASPEVVAAAANVDVAQEFFAYLKTFPPEAWREELQMYLFRLAPITDRNKTGNYKHVQKYLKPIDANEVMREFGSGGYRLMFNRYDPATRKTTLLREHNFDIQNIDFPPRVPLGEWLEDDRNKEWAWARPALLAQQNAAYALNGMGGGMQPGEQAGLVKAVAEIIKELKPQADDGERSSLTEMVMDQMKDNMKLVREASDPSQMLGIVREILTAVKPGNGTGDGLTAVMLQQLKASDERNTLLLTKILERPQKSMIEELKDLKGLSDDLFGGRRRNGPEPVGTTGWDVARDLGTQALKTLTTVGEIYIRRLMMVQGQAGGQPQPPADGSVSVLQAEPVEMTAEDKQKMIATISNQYGVFFDDITPHLVDHFHNFDGFDFQEWFCEEYGRSMYRTIRNFSSQTFVDVIELRKTVAPEAIRAKLQELKPAEKLLGFVQEFLSDPPDDEEEERHDPPVGQTAVSGDF